MKKTLIITASAAILAAQPEAKAVLGIIVSDPVVEEATL